MGSVDKGLQPFRGKPLVAHVLERFTPQVDEVLISANRNVEDYSRFGFRVITDEIEGSAGPLAGLERALFHAKHSLVACVPCDSPFLPIDLVTRLHAALAEHTAQIAVAKTFDRLQPVFCLCQASLAPQLRAYLAAGERRVDKWFATLTVTEVKFDDEADAFANLNTFEDLANSKTPPNSSGDAPFEPSK